MVSARTRRQQVALATRRGLSQRRACALLSVARSTLGYISKLERKDAAVSERIQDLATENPRFGYRRVQVLLEREGVSMSRDRMCRLWQKGLHQVRRKRRRRRARQSIPRPQAASGRNHVWAYDFIFDACANGQALKCLTLVDEWTRECLAIEVDSRLPSSRVIEVLERVFQERGAPRFLRSDNGPEFVSEALLAWLSRQQVDTAFIDPGKPWQNGSVESFNDKFRDECLNQHWFRSRSEARLLIEMWRRRYNEFRPHSSLGYRTPEEFGKDLDRAESLRKSDAGEGSPCLESTL